LVRGGFLVSSTRREDEVELVQIHSRHGETCRLRNPWQRPCNVVEIDGEVRVLSGDVIQFNTQPGKTYRVAPQDRPKRDGEPQ